MSDINTDNATVYLFGKGSKPRESMPLAVLSEFLGHEDSKTTLIYANADTEMKRKTIEKATENALIPEIRDDSPMWESQDTIERLIRGY